jgi:hypothetical protein
MVAGSGRPPPPDANRQCVRFAFHNNSPTHFVRRAPMSTVYMQARIKVSKKFPYKFTMLHGLKPEDYPKGHSLSIRTSVSYGSVGMVYRQNMRCLSIERPDFSRRLDRHNTKVSVSCCLLHDRVIKPFFFHETIQSNGTTIWTC